MRALAFITFLMINFIVWGGVSEIFAGRGGGLWTLLTVMLLCQCAILVHELGHAIATRALGGRVMAFAVAPFELRFSPLRIGLMQAETAEVGGYVLREPRDEAGDSRREAIIVSAAGPAANLILAACAWLAAFAIDQTAPTSLPPTLTISAGPVSNGPPAALALPSDDELRAFIDAFERRRTIDMLGRLAEVLAALSCGLGIANLIPFRNSDGAAIRDALRRGYT